jgi:hypothetical protein
MSEFVVTNDNKLIKDDIVLPFKFDFDNTINFDYSEIYVKLEDNVNVLAKEDSVYHTWSLEVILPMYSDIFSIIGATTFNLSNFELFQDMKYMHGFNYNDIAQFIIKFNFETEEGNKAFGVVNDVIRKLKMKMKLDHIKEDFE